MRSSKWESGRARTRYFSGRRPAWPILKWSVLNRSFQAAVQNVRGGGYGEFYAHISTRQPNQHPIARGPQKKVDHEHRSFHSRQRLLGTRWYSRECAELARIRDLIVGERHRADDLVQDTLLRALAKIDSFEPGTNLTAWLFTILRNVFRTEYRKRRREVEDNNGRQTETLKTYPEQHSHIDFKELQQALGKLPASQREGLILVGASGFSYKEAAEICGCAVGTVKSRVHRARVTLAELLSIEDIDDFRPGSSEPRGDRRHPRYERGVIDQFDRHRPRGPTEGRRQS